MDSWPFEGRVANIIDACRCSLRPLEECLCQEEASRVVGYFSKRCDLKVHPACVDLFKLNDGESQFIDRFHDIYIILP